MRVSIESIDQTCGCAERYGAQAYVSDRNEALAQPEGSGIRTGFMCRVLNEEWNRCLEIHRHYRL